MSYSSDQEKAFAATAGRNQPYHYPALYQSKGSKELPCSYRGRLALSTVFRFGYIGKEVQNGILARHR